jgi:hypothetical protein
MQVKSSGAIATHYISGGDFAIDLLCYFPWTWLSFGVSERERWGSYWRLLPLTRILRAVLRVCRIEVRGSGNALSGSFGWASQWLRFNPGVIRVVMCLWCVTHVGAEP